MTSLLHLNMQSLNSKIINIRHLKVKDKGQGIIEKKNPLHIFNTYPKRSVPFYEYQAVGIVNPAMKHITSQITENDMRRRFEDDLRLRYTAPKDFKR